MGARISAAVSGVRIVLTGMPGSGKSTAGRALSALLGASFEETDAAVEKAAGMTVAEIFASRGEAAFREMESDALRQMLDGDAPAGGMIVGTGGGAVLSEANRRLIIACGGAVYLQASPEILERRLQADADTRPLLRPEAESPAQVIARLLAEREEFYRQTARITVIQHADDTPADVAKKVREGLAHAGGFGILPATAAGGG